MQDTASDEIDLIELIETLWDAKRLIAAITACFAVLSIGVALLLPARFEGSLRITALTNQQTASYQTLNNTPGISAPIYAGEVLIGQAGVVLSEEMFAAFQNKMRQGRIFGAAHQNLDPSMKNFDGTAEELAQKLARIAQTYSFTLDKESEDAGVLSFKTGDRELARAIIGQALTSAADEIRTDNLTAIADLSRSIAISLDFELDEINTQIDNALSDYQVKMAAYRALLKEQAAIARQLGIADYQSGAGAQVGIDISIENAAPQAKQPRAILYLRGYKALEKEIELLDARGKGAAVYPFIDDYADLAARKRALQSDKRVHRIETSLAQTPLADQRVFQAANYDLDTIIFDSAGNKRLIVILATLMGGFIAVIFVLIRSAMAARQAQTA